MALATKHSLLLLVTLALSANAEDTESSFTKVKEVSNTITNEVNYLPPMIVLGQNDGDIVRCPLATPNLCETYHSGSDAVTATLVHGEYLFAALKSGAMLRCTWHRRYSCRVFHQEQSEMTGLAVSAGTIYAGLLNGTIIRCNMNMPHSCQQFTNTERKITSLAASRSFVYAGSEQGRIYRCDTSGKCSSICDINSNYDVTGLAIVGKKIFGLRSGGYIHYGDGTTSSCKTFDLHPNRSDAKYKGMGVYNDKLYLVEWDVKVLRVYETCSNTAKNLASHSQAVSISIAYGSYAMQEKYRIESVKCIWTGVFKCPPTVFYYDDVKRRSTLEVHVKDGKLYDSQGVVVDTSNADESHSQRAAIFAMGPDGQILLSNVHKPGLLHTSSLFAGNPVSGAGLMVVNQGKIANVTACSVHYRPDQALNDQVRESLRAKGYTDSIQFHPCSYSDMLCVFDGTSGNKF